MFIVDYVKKLIPMMSKDKVIEDLTITINDLKNNILPTYEAATEHFKVNKLKSKENIELSNAFYKEFDLHRGIKQSSFISEITKRLPHLIANAELTLKNITEIMEANIVNEGLSTKKANLIKIAEMMSFITRFAPNLLNTVYVNETINLDKSAVDSIGLAPQTIKYVTNKINIFAGVVSDYGIDNKTFKNLYDNIPDVLIITSNKDALSVMHNNSTLDPFSSGLVSGFTYNPIYHIRTIIANYQTSKYEANKEKKKILELRLLYLKLKEENNNDAATEKEINYLQSRIDKLEKELTDFENSVS